MARIPILSLVLVCMIVISSQSSSAFAENSTSTISNYTEPEPINTIQTDKSTYNHNEIIHVTGESSLVNRVQITHSNGDNMINAWLGAPADNSYEYDIDLISLYNGNNLRESGDYIINAIQDQTVLKSKIVYINVPEPIPEPVIENYTEPESIPESIFLRYQPPTTIPGLEILTTMDITIIGDKVVVRGTISPEKVILANGPSLQIIEPDGTGGIVTADSSSFVWDGLNYSTFSLLSNFKDVQEETTFKLWSGNGAKGVALIQKTALITFAETENEPIVEDYTLPISNYTISLENYTEPVQVTKPENQKAQPIELWSDKSVYEDGSIIQIEGKINEESSSVINVKVYNPSNFNIVDESYKVSNNGIFELNFDTSNYIWYENGTYIIQVEDRNNEINKIKVTVTEASLEPVLSQNNTISQINSTSNSDDTLEQLLEENRMLLEEVERQGSQIDALNEQVGYLLQILQRIQGFFGSVFT